MGSLTSLKTVIHTEDFTNSVRFYHEVLGLEVVNKWDEPGDRGRIFKVGSERAFIEILETKAQGEHSANEFPSGMINNKMEIQMATKNLEAWVSRLQTLWPTKGPLKRPWGSSYLYLRDPNGIQIIIYQES